MCINPTSSLLKALPLLTPQSWPVQVPWCLLQFLGRAASSCLCFSGEVCRYEVRQIHFARNLCHVFSRRIKASRLLGVDSAQICSVLKFPRPLDATVEDAETQLCQIVDGFLGTNSSVKNPGCFFLIFRCDTL